MLLFYYVKTLLIIWYLRIFVVYLYQHKQTNKIMLKEISALQLLNDRTNGGSFNYAQKIKDAKLLVTVSSSIVKKLFNETTIMLHLNSYHKLIELVLRQLAFLDKRKGKEKEVQEHIIMLHKANKACIAFHLKVLQPYYTERKSQLPDAVSANFRVSMELSGFMAKFGYGDGM